MPRLIEEPDYEPLVKLLIQQSKDEKLRWEKTARENTYVCAVKGQRTFIVSEGNFDSAVLQVVDPAGKVQFSFSQGTGSDLSTLYKIARRQAEQLDEKLRETLKLLQELQ